MNFKNWLLKEDIFGFEKKNSKNIKKIDTKPIIQICSENIVEVLEKMNINEKIPFSNFSNEIQWGREPGALKLVFGPLGSLKIILKKLQINLEGNEVWVCKKIISYKEMQRSNKLFDQSLAYELFEIIEETNRQEIEALSNEYENLERLTIKIANKSTRQDTLPELFIYRGIKEIVKNENYLIFFECRGHGVEMPDSGRLEQFIIDMSYDKKTGLIRSFGHDVQSPTKGHKWYPQPSDWDEYFSSSQSEEEIIDCITTAFRTY